MHEDAPLRRLIYRSRSRIQGGPGATAREIGRILESARLYNQENDITGALMLGKAAFAQVLEGPGAPLDETFARIAVDPRHDGIEMIENGPAERRAFAGWTMAYAGALDAPDIPLTLSFASLMLNDLQTEILARLRRAVGA
jgi:hypothetical protein